MKDLFLHEEILLLVLRDKEGTIEMGAMYQYSLAGALISDLILKKYIEVETVKKRNYVNVLNNNLTGNELLDECMLLIKTAKRRRTVDAWVSKFSGLSQLKHRVARSLCAKGILEADEQKILLIFNRTVYPEITHKPEKEIHDRIKKVIFENSENFDERTIILISLAHSTGLLKANFDKKLLRANKKRIEAIINGETTGKAAKEAIEAIQAAIMVACIIPAISVSVSN